MNSKLSAIALAVSLVAVAGCADAAAPNEDSPIGAASQAVTAESGVSVTTIQLGPNRYSIAVSATFGRSVNKIWPTFYNFEKLVSVGLPDVTDFVWLDGGGPHKVPSKFTFTANGATILEEVYYRRTSSHSLRYRLLQPALGFVSIDSLLELTRISNRATRYTATRDVTLEPGLPVADVVNLFVSETLTVQDYFAKDDCED